VIHFGQIVVGRGQPENRDGLDSTARRIFGATNGRESFVKSVSRTGEKTDLLARDNGDGPSSETL
jgi:hypothetical protein